MSQQAEQDNASNGNRRLVIDEDHKATGRVKLVRKRHARRLYAVLVWDHNRRFELPLGEVTSPADPRTSVAHACWSIANNCSRQKDAPGGPRPLAADGPSPQ